jgi:hypothetical protein
VLYGLCKEFNTLPKAGGFFDQDPDIIDDFKVIIEGVANVEKKKQKDYETQMRKSQSHRRIR